METRQIERFAPEEIGMSLSLALDPVKALAMAKSVGEALNDTIEKKDRDGEPLFYQKMGKNRHAKFELWQLVAFCFGVTTRLVSVCSVYDDMSGAAGFEAIVESLHGTRIIGQAAARCLNNEDNWNTRPKYVYEGNQRREVARVPVASYQLESMAQTRAASKVLASHFRWILILSGFSGTPAEEADGTEPGSNGKEKSEPGQPPKPGEKITDKERRQIFGAAKSHGIGFNDLPQFWTKHGFERAEQITVEKFPEIIKEIEAHKPPTGQ